MNESFEAVDAWLQDVRSMVDRHGDALRAQIRYYPKHEPENCLATAVMFVGHLAAAIEDVLDRAREYENYLRFEQRLATARRGEPEQ